MKYLKFLFSGTFMGILLIVFAISMGWATFIENDFDSTTARMIVYNAWWFEAIMVLMVINFAGTIFTRQLYRKSKWNILVLHVAFIIIIIGAGITRYFGFEGYMHIRNGETSSRIVSRDSYVNMSITDGGEKHIVYNKIIFTPIKYVLYRDHIRFNDKDIEIKISNLIPNATRILQEDESGEPVLTIVAAGRDGRIDVHVKENDTELLGNLSISFGDTTNADGLQVIRGNDGLLFRSPFVIRHIDMQTGLADTLDKNTFYPLQFMKIYAIGSVTLVFKELVEKAKLTYVTHPDGTNTNKNVAQLKIKVNDEEKEMYVDAGINYVANTARINVNDVQFDMIIGAQYYSLPFSLRLNEFELDRYPGSESPSSFASEITLIDEKHNIEEDYRIFMNNILAYGPYRFYQSSYDTDEKGTILSVNQDYWGTRVTYFGYFLLFTSLILVLFTKKTRFAWLSRQIDEIHRERKKLLTGLLLLSFFFINARALASPNQDRKVPGIDKVHADSFGKLLVQNKDGRIIPLNTTSSQILVKIYKKSNYEDANADQVFLGMIAFPLEWQKEPLIKVGDEALQKVLRINGKYASYYDFFDEEGNYKLKEYVNKTYNKSPALRNQFDKELIYVDERLNVSYMAFNGYFLKIFPLPDHPNNKWGTFDELIEYLKEKDSFSLDVSLAKYVTQLREAVVSGDYSRANLTLDAIRDFQKKYGNEIIPPATKTNLEILYNKTNVFKRLFPVYMTLGLILLGIFLIRLFYPSLEFRRLINVFLILLAIAFAVHTVGLGIRWYISGHAPWSNGYESMIYIAWATVLAGFLFRTKSAMTLSVTAILAGITLLTAHMSWLNPEITNLIPVLKSYWLTIHVATITASYGFLALGSMLGFLNLFLMIFRGRNNYKRIDLTIKELIYTIEMALMVGLILLTIGNFLGGIWANESWGRYWGWDPKETWALVTIIVYAFILHIRLIPGLRNAFFINFMAMIGFGSVLMTYFGVNYYLSGLHSYAQGDPVPVPVFVYYLLFFIVLVTVLAAINDHILKKQQIKA